MSADATNSCSLVEAPAVFMVNANGRCAPQGSKQHGSAGQLRESSKYLPAWRAAVRRAVYAEYKRLGIRAAQLVDSPLYVGPVVFGATFRMDYEAGQRIDEPPDMDKLLRGVWDVLTKCRVWEDDGRVVTTERLAEVYPGPGEQPGAYLWVRAAQPWECEPPHAARNDTEAT